MAQTFEFTITDVPPETSDEVIASKVKSATGFTVLKVNRLELSKILIECDSMRSKMAGVKPPPVSVTPGARLCYVALEIDLG